MREYDIFGIFFPLLLISFAISLLIIAISETVDFKMPKIKFKLFSNLYTISSDKWKLNKNTVKYKKYVSEFRISYEEIEFRFSIIDLIRYKHWLKQKDKQDKSDQLNKIIDDIINDAQKYMR